MSSIIQDLQIKASNKNNSVTDLLRMAKIIASKLELNDFLDWINKELNGYKDASSEATPDYREVRGEPKGWNPYHGWVPVLFTGNPESQEIISTRKIQQSIGTLEELIYNPNKDTDGTLQIPFTPTVNDVISEVMKFNTKFTLMIDKSAVVSILDAVRNILLDWALKLEKEGILGEGISFSQTEKEKAQEKVIYNIQKIENFTGNMGAMNGNASITINQNFTDDEIKEIKNIILQLKDKVEEIDISREKKEILTGEVIKIYEEINKEKPLKKDIVPKLKVVKDILVGAGGSLIAQGAVSLITKFL